MMVRSLWRSAGVAALALGFGGSWVVVAERPTPTSQVSEETLLERIVREPGHVPHYLDAADWFFDRGRFDEVEKLLRAAQGLMRQDLSQGERGRAGLPARGRGPLPMTLNTNPSDLLTGRDVDPPALTEPLTPAFPPDALGAAAGAVISVEATVESDGRVRDVVPTAAAPSLLVDAALAATQAASFRPTGLSGALLVELVWFVPGGNDAPRQWILPAPRSLAGYTSAARELRRVGNLATAVAVLDRALVAAQHERAAPKHVKVAGPSGAILAPHPSVIGRAVKSEGELPAYPAAARAAGVGGAVVLSVAVTTGGDVSRVDVVDGTDEFVQPAVAAVRNWRFVPAHVDGVPVPRQVGVTLAFDPDAGAVTDSPRVGFGSIRAPGKIHHVEPLYPPEAQRRREEGTVILEAVISRTGLVREARVLRSVSPLLDDAARRAVLQWRYEQTQLRGVPVEIVMTVTVDFALRSNEG